MPWVDICAGEETTIVRIPTNPRLAGPRRESHMAPDQAWDQTYRDVVFNAVPSGVRHVSSPTCFLCWAAKAGALLWRSQKLYLSELRCSDIDSQPLCQHVDSCWGQLLPCLRQPSCPFQSHQSISSGRMQNYDTIFKSCYPQYNPN